MNDELGCQRIEMTGRNHDVTIPYFNALFPASYGWRLVFLTVSFICFQMIWSIPGVCACGPMSSHASHRVLPQRPTLCSNHSHEFGRFFLWLQRRVSVYGDTSFLSPQTTSVRRKSRTDSTMLPTRSPWERSSLVSRFSTSIHSTLPYMALFPTRRLWAANGGKVVALVSGLYWTHKCFVSDPMRRSFYFWKHAGPIVVHYKFAKWWLTASNANREKRDHVYESLHNQYAQPAYHIILHLRGLYVKMGQILSSRPDFMPFQYVHYFTNLQDKIPAYDTELIQKTANEALRRDCPAFGLYEDLILDPTPLGSASIGQVHRAVLRLKKENTNKHQAQDREVAIKVMHQGAKEKFQNDFQVFRWLCRIAIPSWCQMLDALEQQVMTEFNYLQEAESLKMVRDNILQTPYRDRVCIPEPMMDLSCENVLVMELLKGKKLTESIHDKLLAAFGGDHKRVKDYLKQRKYEALMGGHDTRTSDAILHSSVNLLGKWKLLQLLQQCRNIVDLLVDVHGYQIFRTGVWNGDPHFGNCLQLHDGRLGLIDYGQTRRIDDAQRFQFARIVVALHEDSDPQVAAAAMRAAGFALQNNADDRMMCRYAYLLFDSDEDSIRSGFCIPQEYFKSLMDINPLVSIPDSAIFVGRASLMFRGMGNAIGAKGQIRTVSRWYPHAKNALQEDVTKMCNFKQACL